MKMTDLANMIIATAETYGDMEVTLVEEGTGEVRYVEGFSFDTNGTTIQLEHVGYQEHQLAKVIDELGIADDLNAIFEGLF